MDERQKLSRRRAIELTIATTAVAALATEALLSTTPEAKAGPETMKDNYHEVVNALSIDARRQVAVIQKASGRLHVAVAKPASERVAPGRSLGQLVAEFKGAEIPADFFPGAILANPDGKSMLISSGNAGVGGGQRVLFAGPNFGSYASVSIDFPASHKASKMSADRAVAVLQSANSAQRGIAILGENRVIKLTPDSNLVYNSLSNPKKNADNTYTVYAGSVEGMKKVVINPTTRTEQTVSVTIPGVAGEVKNMKSVVSVGNQEVMVMSVGNKAVVVDANNPSNVVRELPIGLAANESITGVTVNKKNGDLIVAKFNSATKKAEVIMTAPNGSQRTISWFFGKDGGRDNVRQMTQATDVNVLYDENDNDRAAVMFDNFQLAFAIDGNAQLPKVVPLDDKGNEIVVPATNTPVPTNTPAATPTATQAPAIPTATPVPQDKEVSVVDYSAKGGVLTALVDNGSKRVVVRNNAALSQGTFRVISNQLPADIRHIAVSPTNVNEILVTGRDASGKLMLGHSSDGGANFFPSNGPTIEGAFNLSFKPTISVDGQVALIPAYTSNGSGSGDFASYFMSRLNKTTLDIAPVIMPYPSYDNAYRAIDLLRPNGSNYEFFATRNEGSEKVLRRMLLNPATGNVAPENLAAHPFNYYFIESLHEANVFWAVFDVNPAANPQLTKVGLHPGYSEASAYGLEAQDDYSTYHTAVDTQENIVYDLILNGQTRRIARFDIGRNQSMADVPLNAALQSATIEVISPSVLRGATGDRVLGAIQGIRELNQQDRHPLYLLNLADSQPSWKAALITN